MDGGLRRGLEAGECLGIDVYTAPSQFDVGLLNHGTRVGYID